MVWIDADALPRLYIDSLVKIMRSHKATLVANKKLSIKAPHIARVIVPITQDAADNYIIDHLQMHDIVISNDLLLAKRAIDLGGQVLTYTGDIFHQENIASAISMRNFLEELTVFGGVQATIMHKPLDKNSKKRFFDALNRLLAKTNQATVIKSLQS